MTPEPSRQTRDEVRQMLAQARPDQIRRLLDDIARVPVKEAQHYDA
ncbi:MULTISPECIES: hypothetical protein [unclassified Yoonia]|jgi:hypothetical protein|nr:MULTISPECIES: hypothetical protein [unclassified Yoonia]